MTRFSTRCGVDGLAGEFFVVRTGPKNSRVLECGRPRSESFVIPNDRVLNRQKVDSVPLPLQSRPEVVVDPADLEDDLTPQ